LIVKKEKRRKQKHLKRRIGRFLYKVKETCVPVIIISLLFGGLSLYIIGSMFGVGCVFVFFQSLVFGWNNPTYSEMCDFIYTDTTDLNVYDSFSYVCEDFSKDIIENARCVGIKSGFVYLEGANHAIVCFETTDKGLYFVEPQMDYIFSSVEMDVMLQHSVYRVSIDRGTFIEYFDEYLYGYDINWFKVTSHGWIPYWSN